LWVVLIGYIPQGDVCAPAGPKYKVGTRFRMSGKKKLILLVITDLDPAGDTIAENLVNDFREDYGIINITAYKVALTIEQVEELSCVPFAGRVSEFKNRLAEFRF
jgi:5S rRNA maturation endonuclease (ribonuclease M5)